MLDTNELSRETGRPPEALRLLARSGLLPAVMDEGRWLYHADSIEILTNLADDSEELNDELEEQVAEMYEDAPDDYEEDE